MSSATLISDEQGMARAIQAARSASASGEVPVGAACYSEAGELLAARGNASIGACDPSAHAEILCLRDAAKTIGNYRLAGCTLYATLEPCVMCAGAMLHARIRRLVFGTHDPKAGAAGSIINIFSVEGLNHHAEIASGVCAADCAKLLQDFFEQRR